MTNETGAPRDIHQMPFDAVLAGLIGGRALALRGGEQLALTFNDARPVLDWYCHNSGN